LSERIRETFDIDDSVVSALPDADLTASSHDRFNAWRTSLDQRQLMPEYLLPRIVRPIERRWPSFTDRRGDVELSPDALKEKIESLGPWLHAWPLDQGVMTRQDFGWRITRDRLLFRHSLITETVASVLGGELSATTVLDIGCSTGFFSLGIAAHGAKQVDGVDLRPANVAQAQFLAEYYGVDNVRFSVSDAEHLSSDRQWDVVFNLGLLYHVTNPMQLLRQTFDLCRTFAVVDTTCHRQPFSGYVLIGERDVRIPTEGRDHFELHPTYRGVVESLRYAGFSEVIEVVGTAEPPHPTYASGNRRCFIAIK
jgi:tRNA (mo5U34)-methyltransferase